jgi:hypothetical protein
MGEGEGERKTKEAVHTSALTVADILASRAATPSLGNLHLLSKAASEKYHHSSQHESNLAATIMTTNRHSMIGQFKMQL